MKMADVLHSIADMLDQTGGDSDGSNQAKLTPVQVVQHEHPGQDAMIPPLQQELELKKKENDVDNAFDNQEGSDELDDIKKLTGIKAVISNVG